MSFRIPISTCLGVAWKSMYIIFFSFSEYWCYYVFIRSFNFLGDEPIMMSSSKEQLSGIMCVKLPKGKNIKYSFLHFAALNFILSLSFFSFCRYFFRFAFFIFNTCRCTRISLFGVSTFNVTWPSTGCMLRMCLWMFFVVEVLCEWVYVFTNNESLFLFRYYWPINSRWV